VAIFVAFWPYYLSYNYIKVMALAFIIVILISWKLKEFKTLKQFKNHKLDYIFMPLGFLIVKIINPTFKSINQVRRPTLGDLFFPLGILIISILDPTKTIFTIAILCVGLADGLAALIGQRYGKGNIYKIFNTRKSIAGSSTVFIVTLLILIVVNVFSNMHLSILTFIYIPLDVAIVEAIAAFGSDDMLIPITVVLILSSLK
jgi:dolichol kinase